VYDKWSHVYQFTLIFDMEVWFEMKMEGLKQSPHEWGSLEGVQLLDNKEFLCILLRASWGAYLGMLEPVRKQKEQRKENSCGDLR
jgi:hypothetical protein